MFTKADKNYLIDMALIIASVVCIFTGLFYDNSLRFAHEMSGYLMVLLILLHFIFHLRWIKSATKSILSDKTKLIAFLLTLVISIGFCASLFLNKPTGQQERNGFGRQFRNSQNLD